MSVARLLFSGLLVASGLILGAFTLHGHFAPRWAPQIEAASPGASGWEARALVTGDVASPDKARLLKAGVQAGSVAPRVAKPAADTKARKRLAEKKLAEKRLAAQKQAEQKKIAEAKRQEKQEAALPSLWDWLNGNNNN
jgi:hypothetical protein